MRTCANSPGLSSRALRDVHDAVDLRRVGAGARDRACLSSTSSTSTVDGRCRPCACSRCALILSCTAMKRARRSSFTSSGTGSGSALAVGAFDRRIGEAADAVELRLLEEREQLLELGLGLAGKADDERAADREVRADLAPARGCARGCSRRWRAASSASGCAGSRAGTARRGRAGSCPPPSAGSLRRRADRDRRSAGAPRRRARRAPRASSVMRVFSGRPPQKPVRYLTSTP